MGATSRVPDYPCEIKELRICSLFLRLEAAHSPASKQRSPAPVRFRKAPDLFASIALRQTRSGIRAHRQFEVGRWDDDELFAFVAAVRMTFIGQIHSMRSEPPHTWRVPIGCSTKRRVHDLRPIRGFSSRRATPINSLSVRGPSRRWARVNVLLSGEARSGPRPASDP